MEEKINNKRIFAYIPSIIAKMILELDINDEDVFFSRSRKRLLSVPKKSQNQSHNLKKIIEHQSSIEANDEIFPVEYPLSHSIVMLVRLKGFEDLILSLYLKDKKKQSEKLNCEYIPIIFSKILLQISSILSENGGEILKCIDQEAFRYCTSLKTNDFPDGLISIEIFAFNECASLESIDIPESVENIGYKAFVGCTSLKRAKLNAALLGEYSFSGCCLLNSQKS